VITLLADVAAGMNYLHLRNCVHGDLKPANVLLQKQQGAPFGHVAKVSDFGLSKWVARCGIDVAVCNSVQRDLKEGEWGSAQGNMSIADAAMCTV
jgi:serine/threonine protein kinase